MGVFPMRPLGDYNVRVMTEIFHEGKQMAEFPDSYTLNPFLGHACHGANVTKKTFWIGSTILYFQDSDNGIWLLYTAVRN